MLLKALIVDDEPQNRGVLEEYLKRFPDIQTVGSVGNVRNAAEMIQKHDPDILLLDISMPGQDGFDLLAQFPDNDFMIVFTTAYHQYAVKAFDVRAIHYLMKPIDLDHFEEAIARCRREVQMRVDSGKSPSQTEKQTKNNGKLSIPSGDSHLLINTDDIYWVEADGSYCHLHMKTGKSHVVSKNVKTMEGLLDEFGFLRTHKSYLVNTRFVIRYFSNDTPHLVMQDNTEIPVSFRRKKDCLRELKNLG